MSSKICSHLCINETPFQAVRQPLVDVGLKFPRDSRWTKQSFKDEADINTLMARYLSTGEMPVINQVAPQYLDATGMDFQAMQDQVVQARELFMALPSALRSRFANDPGQFLEYVADPANRPEMSKLGLLKPDAAPIPQAKPRTAGEPASDSAPGDATK